VHRSKLDSNLLNDDDLTSTLSGKFRSFGIAGFSPAHEQEDRDHMQSTVVAFHSYNQSAAGLLLV